MVRAAARWMAIAVGGVLGVLALLIVGALIFVHTDRGRELVRAVAEQQLDAAITGGASIGKLDGSPFGTLVARDVVLNGPDGKPAIAVKRLALEVELWPLVRRHAILSKVVVDRADVDLRRDARGELELANLVTPGPSSGWSIHVRELVVTGGRVAVHAGGRIEHLDDLAASGAVAVPADGPVVASLRARATWRERDELPLAIEAAARIDDDRIDVPVVDARAGELRVVGGALRAWLDGPAPLVGGAVRVHAPRTALGIALPDELDAAVGLLPDRAGRRIRGELAARLGDADVRSSFEVEPATRRATGLVATSALDLGAWTDRRLALTTRGFVLFDLALGAGELPGGTALVAATARYGELPPARVFATLGGHGDGLTARVTAESRALVGSIAAELRRRDGAIVLERGHLVARVREPAVASGGRVHGVLDADVTASGELSPAPRLAISGHIDGERVRADDVSAGRLSLAGTLRDVPARPRGRATLTVRELRRGELRVPALAVTAVGQDDGLRVDVRSRVVSPDVRGELEIDAGALVRLGDTIAIELARHRVRVGDAPAWSGRGGRVTISDRRIALDDFASASGTGSIAASGWYRRAGRRAGDLHALVDARGIELAALTAASAGTLELHADVDRRGDRIDGSAAVTATGVVLDHARARSIDVKGEIVLAPRKLAVEATVRAAGVGGATLAIDVAPPARTLDPAAWRRLDRAAIREARLRLDDVRVDELAELAGLAGYAGHVDGQLRLAGATLRGDVHASGIEVPALAGLGDLSGALALREDGTDAAVSKLELQLNTRAALAAEARVRVPARVFDPAAWRALGGRVVQRVALHTDRIDVDPELLARFGVAVPLRGRVIADAVLGDGLDDARLAVAVRSLRAPATTRPIDVDVTVATDGGQTRLEAVVVSRVHREASGADLAIGPRVPLAEITGTLAATLDELRADPRRFTSAPLDAVVRLPGTPVRDVARVFGRDDVVGRLGGTIEVGGTFTAPTARARVIARDLQVLGGTREPPALRELAIDATWDGHAGALAIAGKQDGGELRISATGSPDALDAATVELVARNFDLRPLLGVVPGPAGAVDGRLDADLRLRGLALATATSASIAGEVRVRGGRFPISPAVGTLRRAQVDLSIARDGRAELAVDGRLGGGRATANARFTLVGVQPTSGHATITLRRVSPIGAIEPDIDADATVDLRRAADHWIADVVVRRGKIDIPASRKGELYPAGPPPDMVVDGVRPAGSPRRAVDRPVLVANVTIEPIDVASDELRGVVYGRLELDVDARGELGVVGTIDAERGDLELFGRRYQLERAGVRFDGSLDPLLDIRLTHDFAEVTTTTEVRGRLSNPSPTLTSNPATYSQGQLLAILLGGDPNGAPGDVGERATSAGASLVANQLGGYVKRALPVDLDVLRYQAATASESASITVGRWLTRSLFVAYRQRLEAQPDENSGEAQLEYWISRRVLLEGVVGDRNVNSVDLIWRKRY